MNSCARWVRIGSSHQFPLSHHSSAVFHPSSPWREQSHEPLMTGFLFASAQPRLQLMNKSNEWHVIIEQGVRDGQRVGASGRKPEIICLENLQNEQESLCFDFFLCSSAVLHLCTGWRESDHFVWIYYSKDSHFLKLSFLLSFKTNCKIVYLTYYMTGWTHTTLIKVLCITVFCIIQPLCINYCSSKMRE